MGDAATGSRSVFARGVEKVNLGLPQGGLKFLNFNPPLDISRQSEENESKAITGRAGVDKGTPSKLTYGKKLPYDLTVPRILLDLAGMYGRPTSVTSFDDLAWLVKFRPDADRPRRGVSLYLHDGGDYGAQFQVGRRVPKISMATKANERVDVGVTYTEPTGETISGFAIAKTGNVGTQAAARIGTRGRRPYDVDYRADKSVFFLVVSTTATSAVLKALVATKGNGTGGGFPLAGDYGATSFTIYTPSHDSNADGIVDGKTGWSHVINSVTGAPIGLAGENKERYEVTFGDQALTLLTAADQFEIPAKMGVLTKVTTPETRLSGFHLVRTVGDVNEIRIDDGSIELERGYKEHYGTGQRLPDRIDPTGYVKAQTSFKKVLFDRLFREANDVHARFTLHDVMKDDAPVDGTTDIVYEGMEIFTAQNAVGLKSGEIPGPDRLDESVTLNAEEPDDDVTLPNSALTGTAEFAQGYPVQIHLLTLSDPAWVFDV